MTPVKTKCKASGCHLWQEHRQRFSVLQPEISFRSAKLEGLLLFFKLSQRKRNQHMQTTLSITKTSCTNSLWTGGCLVSTTPCTQSWEGSFAGRWGAFTAEDKGKTSKASFQSWWAHCHALPWPGWARLTPAWPPQGCACSQGSSFGREHCDLWVWMQTWMDCGEDPHGCEAEPGMLQYGDFVAMNLEKQQPRGLWRGCWLVECRAASERSEDITWVVITWDITRVSSLIKPEISISKPDLKIRLALLGFCGDLSRLMVSFAHSGGRPWQSLCDCHSSWELGLG